MAAPTMKILYGPPGTGKTYRAAREAIRVIDGHLPASEPDVRQRHEALVQMGRIIWVTFHPSYAYEDFVEGYRPFLNAQQQIVYRVEDGPFKFACSAVPAAHRFANLRPGDSIGSAGRYHVLRVDPCGVLLETRTNRADAVTGRLLQYADAWTIDHLIAEGIAPNELSPPGQRNVERQAVARRTELPTTVLTNSGHYRAVLEWLDAQSQHAPQPVVLIIDEINRADLSRVFGELMTLLEPDKRAGASEERSVILPYSRTSFVVPSDLSVIGTMNTADRSLAVLDVALRRRFDFEEVEPDPSLCSPAWGGVDIQTQLRQWNERITALLSRDLRIGHSELMEGRLRSLMAQHGWTAADAEQRALAWVIRHKVVPLLLEYFFDDWRKARFVLGNDELVAEQPLPAVTQTQITDLFDLDERAGFALGSWWNPTSGDWDAARFVSALTA